MINLYTDTRGKVTEPLPFTKTIIEGLAPGGGLFVPKVIPHLELDEILELAELPYAQRAAHIYKRFGVDFDDGLVDRLMATAYGDNFDTPEIAPLTHIDDQVTVLELWHGPTSAFKDMALQNLPVCFSAAVDKLRAEGEDISDYLILVATSGDTGKAALEGFKDRDNVSIVVFYPHGGVSDIQYKQMATQRGGNVGVFAAEGNFDDCQTSVKATFNDQTFNQQLLEQRNLRLSSANSINWGRLLPQIVYYISAYSCMVAQGRVEAGAPIDVCVPTGNFGNILGAFYAKEMGTPIDMLFCASNENRILTDFINTGTYDISDRPFILTPSPSMDILVSSNLERLLFELTGRDPERIRTWMDDLATKRCYRVDRETFGKVREVLRGDAVSNNECLETIHRVYEEYGYLLDPHTAVAFEVADRLKGGNPVLVVSTAHWAKFGGDVYRALKGIPAGGELPADVLAMTGAQLNAHIAELTGVDDVPAPLAELDDLPIRFSTICQGSTQGVESSLQAFLEGTSSEGK